MKKPLVLTHRKAGLCSEAPEAYGWLGGAEGADLHLGTCRDGPASVFSFFLPAEWPKLLETRGPPGVGGPDFFPSSNHSRLHNFHSQTIDNLKTLMPPHTRNLKSQQDPKSQLASQESGHAATQTKHFVRRFLQVLWWPKKLSRNPRWSKGGAFVHFTCKGDPQKTIRKAKDWAQHFAQNIAQPILQCFSDEVGGCRLGFCGKKPPDNVVKSISWLFFKRLFSGFVVSFLCVCVCFVGGF